MIGGIKRILEKQLNAGDEIGAIATYEKYGDYLPLPLHDPMADDLKMRLAKVASERKLTSLALKIIEPYKKHAGQVEAKELMAAIERNLSIESYRRTRKARFLRSKNALEWSSVQARRPKNKPPIFSSIV